VVDTWIDRRKRHRITFCVDDVELEIIKEMAEAFEVPVGEAIRRAIWAFYILYDPELKVKDALREGYDPEGPLADALKPIPELAYILGIELKIWRRQQMEKHLKEAGKVGDPTCPSPRATSRTGPRPRDISSR
jgi:hypothetical protein